MRRTGLATITDILVATRTVALKSHIIQRCNLCTADCDLYIRGMLESGLLEAYPLIDLRHVPGRKSRRRMYYQSSKKGKEFLRRYKELLFFLVSEHDTKRIRV